MPVSSGKYISNLFGLKGKAGFKPFSTRRFVSLNPERRTGLSLTLTLSGFLGGADENGDNAGKVPLAVIGVVPVKVTGENGAIKPGNLLVTSSTPGHAMKAGADRRVGTIIGKALASFNGSSGVIQMLVVLQ